jgi:hypothetical protein
MGISSIQEKAVVETESQPSAPVEHMPVSRKAELESLILESYRIIVDYQRDIQVTNRPEDRVRGQRQIEGQWNTIKGYLQAYAPLVQGALPQDIAEIAAHFPEFRSRRQPSVPVDDSRSGGSALSSTQRQRIEQRIKEATASLDMVDKFIEALKHQLALELDGQRRVVLQARLDERERERDKIEAELERLQGQL